MEMLAKGAISVETLFNHPPTELQLRSEPAYEAKIVSLSGQAERER